MPSNGSIVTLLDMSLSFSWKSGGEVTGVRTVCLRSLLGPGTGSVSRTRVLSVSGFLTACCGVRLRASSIPRFWFSESLELLLSLERFSTRLPLLLGPFPGTGTLLVEAAGLGGLGASSSDDDELLSLLDDCSNGIFVLESVMRTNLTYLILCSVLRDYDRLKCNALTGSPQIETRVDWRPTGTAPSFVDTVA